MFIFYDFETSSRELLGQILTYTFFLVSPEYEILDELSGQIRLNRTQVPEIDAILVNRIHVDHLQANGQAEYEAAADIYHFLDNIVRKYETATLVGFNSNSFDLSFLRNLLIGHGLNPYFMGKLKNLDLLHFAQFLAFQNADDFPWVRVQGEDKQYYSFKLEDLTHAFSLLEGEQTHDAREDVLLTIKLARYLEVKYELPLVEFKPIFFPSNLEFQGHYEIFKQKARHFAGPGEGLEKFVYKYYLKLCMVGKSYLMVDLEAFGEGRDEAIGSLKYVNPNKHFYVVSAVDGAEYEAFSETAQKVSENKFLKEILANPNLYFDLNKKDWDISYQIHELGFERIDTLKGYVNKLITDPQRYPTLLQELLSKRSTEKDNYMIQLFNRVYLNTHPEPDIKYLMKYLEPRYITGALQRDSESFVPFEENFKRLQGLVDDPETSEADLGILKPLLRYYQGFQTQYFIANLA